MERVTDTTPIRLIIADDDPLVRQSLELLLAQASDGRIDVVATCADGQETIAAAEQKNPDVILMDMAMPHLDGIEATLRIKSANPDVRILILTSLSPRNAVERAVEKGADGFISKADDIRDMVRHITEVHAGHPQFSPSSQQQLLADMRATRLNSREDEARRLLDSLPERERETVIHAAKGLSNQEIALQMCVSERTVKAHLMSACDKLGMNRVMLARLVERAGL